MAEGLFFSVLNYGIEVYANVWFSATLNDQTRNSTSFIKKKKQKATNSCLESAVGSD